MHSEPTDAALDWLQAHYRIRWRQRDPAVLAAEFNAAFGCDVDAEWIQRAIDECGRPPRREANRNLMTWAEDRFIRKTYVDHSAKDTIERLNARFGKSYTYTQFKEYTCSHGIKCGRTGYFPKGHRPPNKGQIGDEVIHRYGVRGGRRRSPEIHVIVDEPNPWTGHRTRTKRKAIIAWEEANGAIPKGSNIVHIDGDWRNCELDNLACLTDGELAVLNRHFAAGDEPDREVRLALILSARLKARAHQREREHKETT